MPLASNTPLTNQSGIIVPDEWMKGTNVAFVDSPLIYSGGTNDFVMIAHTSTRVVVRVSQDKGVTWSQLTLSASDPMSADDAPHSVCLASDGKAHCCSKSFEYTRISFTRSGGHITGYSWDTASGIAIPGVQTSGYYINYRANIKRVFNGLGNECFIVSVTSSSTEAQNTIDLRVGAFVTTGIAISAATDFKSLTGTASAATLIRSSNTATENASNYETWADIAQHPTSHACYLFFGNHANETVEGAAPVGYYPITPDTGASTWTVGAVTILGHGVLNTGPGWLLWGTAVGDHVYAAYDPGETGPRICKIDESGTLTASFLTIDTLQQRAIGTFDCTPDGSKFFASYCQNWYWGTPNTRHAFYESGAWSYIDDSGTFDSQPPALPGTSKVVGSGVLSGLCAFLNPENLSTGTRREFWVATQWASTAQVGGTLSYTATGGATAGGSANARGHVPGVVFEAAGTVAYSAANGASVAPGYPTMIAGNPYGDALVAFVHQKPSTANSGSVTTPSGWTLLGSITGAGGYSTTIGADTGNTNLFVYTKDTVTGSESGTLSITVGTNSVSAAQIHRISKQGSGAWQFAVATGSRNASANGTVAVQMSTDPGLTVGDLVIGYFGIPTDVTTPSQFSAESFSATGVTTWGTLAEVNEPDSGNGNDIGGVVIQNRVLAGTSSAAPYFNATATGTTTNVRGPIAILRAREATNQTSSYTTVGGALTGGAAAEKRTWLQAVAGGALAGAAAAMKRTTVALVAAGAIAGGAASVTTATATGLSYTAIGGAVSGGAATIKQVRTQTGAAGAIVGGAVSETRVAIRAASGGSVAAGAATCVRSAKVSGSSGAVVGGAVTEARTVKSLCVGGALVGGTATVTINAPSVLRYTAAGGAESGGAVVEKRASRGIVAGGCVAGGAANEKRTVVAAASGGAVSGGVAGKLETRRVAAAGGSLAGGVATEKRVAARATAGGSIAGAVVRVIQAKTWTPTGGAIVGGEAQWASSAPKSYYYEGDGGAAAGGLARVIATQLVTASGGALVGGAVASSRTQKSYVAGGAITGGSAPDLLIGVRRGIGGAVTGGSARTIVVTSRAPVGGALAGGAAAILEIQPGVMSYTARGGALAGGISTVVGTYVALPIVHLPASIKVFEFALYSVEKSTQEPMRPIYVGDTIPLVFETKELNGNTAGPLYDPSQLVVTIRFEPSGFTDSITYGGAEASNVYLTRLSVGRYRLLYPAGSVEGYAWIEARVSEDVAGVAYAADMLAPVRVLIRPLKTGHRDAPASV